MSLQDLPPELTERVVVLLPLSDINSLRLSNKSLALKTAQKHLKASFRTKRIELTEQRLRSFVAVTASGGLGCLLQDLTLVAPVYNTSTLATRLELKAASFAKLDDDGRFVEREWRNVTDEDRRQIKLDLAVLQERLDEQLDLQHHQRDVELLSQALSNLAMHGASIRMLRTEVTIYEDDITTPLLPLFGGHEGPIWTSTGYLGRTLFTSLAACNLPIQNLNLFNSTRMQRCSLSINDLNNSSFATVGLNSSFGHLVELSLRVSDHHLVDHAHQSVDEGLSEKAIQEPNVVGLRSLLRACSFIQKLDLAHFSRVFVKRENKQHGRMLQVLGESRLRYLRCLTLQGFDFNEHELLTSLQSLGSLQSLSLRAIHLGDGSFKPIFDYCTMKAAMESLELDCLFENELIQFEPPWALPTRSSVLGRKSGAIYPGLRASYRRPSGSATDHQVKFHEREGRTMDTPATRAWRQHMENCFGPLPENGKPSCLQPRIRR